MYCCSNCFNDSFLSTIINRESIDINNCDFCKTANTNVVEPHQLSDYFQLVLDLYDSVEREGQTIAQLLKSNWMLFGELDDSIVIELIQHISGVDYDGQYTPKTSLNEEHILNWQEFKAELKHTNRYFPKKAPNYDHIKKLLGFIIVSEKKVPSQLYRSRVNTGVAKIEISEMGKPPEKISTAGRANPVGIPYLYTASDIDTAIAEIRPHKGDTVTIATFNVKEPLILADLRNPRQSISPFELDEDGLNQVFSDLEYLCHLGEELSKPILPREAHLEYLSSQYLCELIKHCGYDGVVYKSSVGTGDNYAIFYEEKLDPENETAVYEIKDVNIVSLAIG